MTTTEVRRVGRGNADRERGTSLLVLLLSSALGVLGTVLVLVLTARNGPGVTPDSVSYLAAARSLLDGEGLRGPDGEPFVAFPPLFPALIAGFSLGVFDLVDAASVVVAVSFGLTVFLAGWAVGRISGSWVWAALAAAAVLVSEPVLVTALHVWSEAPFMALAMLSLGLLVASALPSHALRADPSPVTTGEGSLNSPRATAQGSAPTDGRLGRRSRSDQAPLSRHDGRGVGGEGTLALVAGAGAVLTRYIGVVLPLTQAGIALMANGAERGVRVRRAALALLCLVPLALWLVRNLVVSGSLLGERTLAAATFSENARAATEALLGWLVPLDVAMRWRALIVLIVVLLVLVPLVIAARRGEQEARRLLSVVLPFALFAALYAGYLVLGATVVAVDPIDDRLIAPLLPALVVAAVVVLGGLCEIGGSRWVGIGRAAAVAAVLVWLAASTVQAGRFVRRVESDGIGGYAAARWAGSETLARVRDELPEGAIVSNDPFAIHYHTGREARLSPRRHPYRAPQGRVEDLPNLMRALDAGETVYLVWFDGVPRDFLLSLSDLEAILELEPVVRASDGAVYRVRGLK